MKSIFALVALMALIVPTCGSLNTTTEIAIALETAHGAGLSQSFGMQTTALYKANALSYGYFYTTIRDCNLVIRSYNRLLDENFNQSMIDVMSIPEFSI
jgi:hypothetical protein